MLYPPSEGARAAWFVLLLLGCASPAPALVPLQTPPAKPPPAPAPSQAPAQPASPAAKPAAQAGSATAAPAAAPKFKEEELVQVTAPIALYTDDLVSQILMASTYPIEVIEASIAGPRPTRT